MLASSDVLALTEKLTALLCYAREMEQVAEYVLRADECAELARKAATEEHKRKILKLAAAWQALAEQRRHHLHLIGRWRKAPH